MAGTAKAIFSGIKPRLEGLLGGARSVGKKAMNARPRHLGDAAQAAITGSSLKNLGQDLRNNPLLTAGFMAGGAGFLAGEVGRPIYDAATAYRPSVADLIADDRRRRRLQKVQAIETQIIQKRMMESAARLAALNPQLYNEIMVGRTLPRGAAVFGGQPRTDLMDQLAYDMATGQYEQPPDPDAELMALLGG